MVRVYRKALVDPVLAADCMMAYRGIEAPTMKARVGAALEASFMTSVIHLVQGFASRK